MAYDPFLASLPSNIQPIERPSMVSRSQGTDVRSRFANHLEEALDAAEAKNVEANEQGEKAAMGEASVHEVALALEKADISMRLLVKSRNKLVEAYQEIMRMPV